MQLRAELHSEIAARSAATEGRVNSSELTLGAELKRINEELVGRMGKLETALPVSRFATLESDVMRMSELISSFIKRRLGEEKDRRESGKGSVTASPHGSYKMAPGEATVATTEDEEKDKQAPLVPNISKELKGQLEILVQAVNRTFHTRVPKPPCGASLPVHVEPREVRTPQVRACSRDRASLTIGVRPRFDPRVASVASAAKPLTFPKANESPRRYDEGRSRAATDPTMAMPVTRPDSHARPRSISADTPPPPSAVSVAPSVAPSPRPNSARTSQTRRCGTPPPSARCVPSPAPGTPTASFRSPVIKATTTTTYGPIVQHLTPISGRAGVPGRSVSPSPGSTAPHGEASLLEVTRAPGRAEGPWLSVR